MLKFWVQFCLSAAVASLLLLTACGGSPPCEGADCCEGPDCPCEGPDCPCEGPDCPCEGPDCPCEGPDCPCEGPDCPCEGPGCPCAEPGCPCERADTCGAGQCCLAGECSLACACDDSSQCADAHCCADGACVPEPNRICNRPPDCTDPPRNVPSPCRSITVTTQADFAQLASLSCIGNVNIVGPGVNSIPGLPTRIRGNLVIENTAVQAIRLDGLTEVGGSLRVSNNPNLTQFIPTVLTRVGRQFTIANNPQLMTMEFPFLSCIAGGGPINDNPLLSRIHWPALIHLQTMEIRDNAVLSSVNLPQLRSAGMTQSDPNRLVWAPREVTFYRLPALTDLILPSLQSIDARVTLEETGATTLSAPRLRRIDGLFVGNNPALNSLSLPLLTELGPRPGWCPLTIGGLSDPCAAVYYVVDNLIGIAQSGSELFASICTANGVPADAEVLIDDSQTTYLCDLQSCQCAAE